MSSQMPPFYEELSPKPTNAECIRLIHHGGLHQSRKLENMIFLMDLLDERFHLDVMLLLNSPRYARYLQQLKELAHKRPRIHFPNQLPCLRSPELLIIMTLASISCHRQFQ
jgi:hypothetical protein